MKKLLLTLFSIGMIGVAQAQTFNGIKVGQSFAETKQQLQTKGYVEVPSSTPTIKNYKGTFDGSPCLIKVVLTPTSKLVWKLIFETSPIGSWSSAESEYEKYKNIMTAKYGNPVDDFHFFSSPYEKGDGYEMLALYSDKCTYSSYFKDPFDNYIYIDLQSFKYGQAVIWISYENKEAADKKNSEQNAINNETF